MARSLQMVHEAERGELAEGLAGLAVGGTAILADTPSPSLLKRLLKGEGGAAE